MIDKKYVFLIDVDETLVPQNGAEMSSDIFDEIERLKKLGHIFVVSTGRSFEATLCIKRIEAFQYLSVLLGSCIYKMPERKLLYKAANMPEDEVRRFVKFLDDKDVAWSYKDEVAEKTLFKSSEFFKYKMGCQFVTQEEFEFDITHNRVMQMLVDCHISKDDMEKFPGFDFCLMPKGYTDVSLKNFLKDRCVDFFRKRFPTMTTVAIGDSENDLSMFKKADLSIAMGNAEDNVKKQATFVTKDMRDDGLIYAFRNILKI